MIQYDSKKRLAFGLAIFLVGLIHTHIAAQQQNHWKFFRGEKFDGHSTERNINDNWPDAGPPVLWTRKLGVGYSGFVGQQGKIYTQYQDTFGQYVLCMDSKSGETVWKHRYAWPYDVVSLYPGPRSTPTLANGRLFFTTPTGSLGCLDAENGEVVWTVDAADLFDAPDVEFGYACSPVCVDGKIFIPVGGPDASMVAFDQKDGSILWSSGNEHISYCSALPIKFQGRELIVGYFENSLCLFDQNSGKQLDRFEVSNGYDEHSAWPIYQAPYLWVAGPFRTGSRLFELQANEDGIQLKLIRHSSKMSNDVASSVLIDGKLYGYDIRDVQSKVHRPSRGQFICMDFLTGEVAWKNGTLGRRTEADVISSKVNRSQDEVGHASVIAVDNKLVLFNDTGELILCEANPESYVELARATVLGGEVVWTHPMLMDGCIYVRNHTQVACVFLRDIAELTQANNSFVYADQIAQPKYINWASIILGTEPKYAMTAPTLSWLIKWYVISIIGGWLVAPGLAILFSRIVGWPSTRAKFLAIAFLFGVLGTSAFGHWRAEFYFSWPIALAIVFECLVCQLKSNQERSTKQKLVARLFLYSFAGLCFGYFWLCRRLSLAFEWSFLMGFPVAIPFLWLVKRNLENSDGKFTLLQWLGSSLAFSAFYWCGAAFMLWKYSA